MRRRVRAAVRYHDIDKDDLRGRLLLRALPGEKLAVVGKDGGITPGQLEKQLRVWITKCRIDLVIFDPFV